MDLISIIIPVYNVEPYLEQCLCSILEQTYENWELLLIDDGSTDQSGSICDQFAQKDYRIRVFHCSHTTVGQARNVGLDHCTGEYICFVDADDHVASDMLQVLHDSIIQHGGDVSACFWYRFYDGQYPRALESKTVDVIIFNTAEQFIFNIYDLRNSQYRSSVWGKLFKREVFDGIRFSTLIRASDTPIWPVLLHSARRVVQSTKVCYYYRIRMGSIMHSNYFNESIFCNLQSLEMTLEGVKRYFPKLIAIVEMFYYYSHRRILEDMCRHHCENEYSDKIHTMQRLLQQRESKIFHNPYISLPGKFSFFVISRNLKLYMMFYKVYVRIFGDE